MRRLPTRRQPSAWIALLLLASAASHAQRVTEVQNSAVISAGYGCIYPRCFSSPNALDGDTAITSNVGVGVMVRTGPGAWALQQVLWNPDGMPTVQHPNTMGGSAALKGDTLLLTGTSRKYNGKPVLYAWQRSGTTWSHTQVLALPRTSAYDTTIVRSVAMSETHAAVCGVRHDYAETRRLVQIDVFARRPGGLFQRQAQITPAVTVGGDLECKLGMEGMTLIVGDPMHDAGRGRVHVYQRGTGGWTLRARLAASDSSEGAHFGASVSISGSTIAIGAPLRPNFDNALHEGAVYVFQRTAAGWAQVQLLVRPEWASDDPTYDEDDEGTFGESVALSGDRLASGWSARDGRMPLGFVYELRGVWAPVASVSNGEGGSFGGNLLLSGTNVVQGVDDGHSGAWSVIYELPPLWTLPPRVE